MGDQRGHRTVLRIEGQADRAAEATRGRRGLQGWATASMTCAASGRRLRRGLRHRRRPASGTRRRPAAPRGAAGPARAVAGRRAAAPGRRAGGRSFVDLLEAVQRDVQQGHLACCASARSCAWASAPSKLLRLGSPVSSSRSAWAWSSLRAISSRLRMRDSTAQASSISNSSSAPPTEASNRQRAGATDGVDAGPAQCRHAGCGQASHCATSTPAPMISAATAMALRADGGRRGVHARHASPSRSRCSRPPGQQQQARVPARCSRSGRPHQHQDLAGQRGSSPRSRRPAARARARPSAHSDQYIPGKPSARAASAAAPASPRIEAELQASQLVGHSSVPRRPTSRWHSASTAASSQGRRSAAPRVAHALAHVDAHVGASSNTSRAHHGRHAGMAGWSADPSRWLSGHMADEPGAASGNRWMRAPSASYRPAAAGL